MTPVFLDTVALIALTNRVDSLHAAAIAVMHEVSTGGGPLVTSDWVLAEFLAGAARPPHRAAAIETVTRLRTSRQTKVLEANRADWDAAFELLRSRNDKAWSLVDCASILACRELGIRRVFTHDRHFKQAGFDILLR